MARRDAGSVQLRRLVPGPVEVETSMVGGRRVILARTAPTTRRGALRRRDGDSLAEAARYAVALRLPLLLELATSGADVSDGIDALHGWGSAALELSRCSGSVPVLAGVTGPVVSGPALMLGLADFVVMEPGAMAYVSGPSMVAAFTGRTVTLEQLGGASVHTSQSGLCALESESVGQGMTDLLAYLPSHCDELPPSVPSADPIDRQVPELRDLVPGRSEAAYDIRDVIAAVVDDGCLLEVGQGWAAQLVTGFARVAGGAVGIIGNQPKMLAGTLDISASQKGARFVQFCNSFGIPLLTFVDTPGFLPGKDLEWRGMIRHGAELAFAYATASVPRVCVILRKAYGGAYIVMDSKGLGNDVCLAWPGAEVAVMGSQGASRIIYRTAPDAERLELEAAYQRRHLTPWPAADRGLIDAVIDPSETRIAVADALSGLATKREALAGRKHDAGPM